MSRRSRLPSQDSDSPESPPPSEDEPGAATGGAPVRRRFRRPFIGAVILLAMVGVGVAADWWIAFPEETQATYVGHQSCIECHQKEFRRWEDSDHDLAMEEASAETVLGDFDNQLLEHHGITTRIYMRDANYFMETEGPDGERAEFQVKYAFGYEPLQQYLADLGNGRLQVLPATWATEENRWFYANPDAPFGPDDPLHWTGSAQNWNHMCADCHSTNFHKGFDVESFEHNWSFSEIDVSCEACHGPGSLHVELANAKSLFWDRRHGYGLAKLKTKSTKPQLDTCAPCHARRQHIYPGVQAGDEFLDHFTLSLLEEHLYHPDGQIDDEVYVYGSFMQSRMYRKDVRCTDCHDPHTTRLKYEGNRLCTQCHMAAKYDAPVHHHHKVDSEGALCIECHMPSKKYMVVDPRRDHSLRMPRPDLTVKLGVPNACNDCHTKPEETAQWAADKVVEWYGPQRTPDPHYGEIIAAGRQSDPNALDALIELAEEHDVGPIVRGTAISLLATNYRGQQRDQAIGRALKSSEAIVRHAALRAFEGMDLSDPDQRDRLALSVKPLLFDIVRSVRTEAARLLAPISHQVLNAKQLERFKFAIEEHITGLEYHNDQAGSQLTQGVLNEQLGLSNKAERAYRRAIQLDPAVAGPRSNLAALLEQHGDSEQARRLREEEEQRLARDVSLLPENAMLHYRLGLLRYILGRASGVEEELLHAVELEPRSTEFLLTLTLWYEKQQRWPEAVRYARRLVTLESNNDMFRRVLDNMEQQAAD